MYIYKYLYICIYIRTYIYKHTYIHEVSRLSSIIAEKVEKDDTHIVHSLSHTHIWGGYD